MTWIRYAGMAEMAALFGLILFIATRVNREVPREVTWLLHTLAAIPAVVFSALLFNAAAGEAVTPGAHVVTYAAVPIVLACGWLAGRVGRVDHDIIAEFRALADELDEAPPCPTPECVTFRERIRHIAGRPTESESR